MIHPKPGVKSCQNLGIALVFCLAVLAAGPVRAQSCQGLAPMHENFLQLYPTGRLVQRVSGAEAEAITDSLRVFAGTAVVFLYSGDGPTTGARGRYMYLVVDESDCIRAHGWIDGEVFDRLQIGE